MHSINDALNEETFPGNQVAFAELKILASKGNIVGFVGAGASASLYPTWSRVLLDLLIAAEKGGFFNAIEAAELRAQIDLNPLDVASAIEYGFTRQVFRSRLGKIFRENEGECSESHRLLVRLGLKGLVTLNYDNGLEAAYSKETSRAPSAMSAHELGELVRWLQGETFAPTKLPILHLHGTPSDPDRMVFTAEDYNKFYDAKHTAAFVEQLWRSERLLVVGFGFSDPFLTRVAERVLLTLPSDLRHYAIIGRKEGEPVSALSRRQFAWKYRLNPIFYQIRNDVDGTSSDHSDLRTILEALLDANPNDKRPEPASAIITDDILVAPTKNLAGSQDSSDFEKYLSFAPHGKPLYAEPRLFRPEGNGDDNGQVNYIPISVDAVVRSERSYIISTQREYGATTLCRRLLNDINLSGEKVFLRDAENLPNYRKKLQEEFPNSKLSQLADATLVLDGFNQERHERLLKELIGLNYFKRFIICVSGGSIDGKSSISADSFPLEIDLLTLAHMERSDIRSLATALFDTSDENLVSTVVDKVYGDLLDLCIPLTPTNVIMYLTILYREGDFQPLNRVQIVERYVNELLRKPSDVYSESFNTKNKIDVISAFVFDLHQRGKTTFIETEWMKFCAAYMERSLLSFDERALYLDLLRSRIIVNIGSSLYFKYKLFYSYFLGLYVANRREILSAFVKAESYLSIDGLVEVISGCSVDSSDFITELVEKIEICMAEFNESYAIHNRDPFASVQWPLNPLEDDKLWKPLAERLSAGPATPETLDSLKRSIQAEKRSEDQTVVLRKFDAMERRLIAYHGALREALRNSDSLDGPLKIRAVRAAIDAYFIIYQVGLIYAPLIAKRNFYVWNGLFFINQIDFKSSLDAKDSDARSIFMVMISMAHAVAERGAYDIGSRKLGEVFKALADEKLPGFRGMLNYTCILRSKPRSWHDTAETTIRDMDRKSFYLKEMLARTFDEFNENVNSGGDRERLKRLVAVIRAKRDLKKDSPGSKMVTRVLGRLESGNAFSPAKGDG